MRLSCLRDRILVHAIFVGVLFLSSCTLTELPLVSVVQDFGDDGIPQGVVFDLTTTAEDSASLSLSPNDVILTLRYTNRCHSRDVIFNIEQNSLRHTQPDSSQVVFHLFSTEGHPLGKGNYGVYELSDTIRKNFNVPDGYVVSVQSMLPESATTGIKSLGLIIK